MEREEHVVLSQRCCELQEDLSLVETKLAETAQHRRKLGTALEETEQRLRKTSLVADEERKRGEEALETAHLLQRDKTSISRHLQAVKRELAETRRARVEEMEEMEELALAAKVCV
eukprot:2881241-Rhodomonas_salina.1